VGQFIRRTILGGVFLLVPILAAIYLLGGMVRGVQKLLDPLVDLIHGDIPPFAKDLLAIAIVALCCFFLGLAAETGMGRHLAKASEKRLLSKLPGYAFFKRLAQNLSGVEQTLGIPVLVRLDDSAMIGFLIDEGLECSVFIPSSPTVATGSVIVVTQDRVHRLDTNAAEVLRSLSKWGFDSQKLLTAKAPSA
jgi:uncharacterized membrane protein